MAILDSILKSRDITLLTKVCLVKAMAFPVVMNGCEVWTIKKTEHRRIDAFELCFGEDSWSARRSNQSILKKIFPEYSLEGPILWPPDAKNWFIGYDPDAGKNWRQEEKGMTEDEIFGWHHHLNGHEFEQAPGVHNGQGNLACCSTWDHKETDFLSNWTELNPICDNAYA